MQHTDRYKLALKLAEDEAAAAIKAGHTIGMGTEHLLIGAFRAGGIATNVLRKHGITLDSLRAEIVDSLRAGSGDLQAVFAEER